MTDKDILKSILGKINKHISSKLEHADKIAALSDMLPKTILEKWFIKGGGFYYFLFRKNLSITNISFSELISLIKIHCTPDIDGRREDLQFRSSEQFQASLVALWVSLSGKSTSLKDVASFIVEHYFDFFSKTVLIDSYFSSAVVYIPKTLHEIMKDKLQLICGESGYIQSCGRAIYVANTEESNKADFLDELKIYIKTCKPDKKIFFSAYSNEQFTGYEKSEDKQEFFRGLHDVKIHLDKFYFGSTPIYDLLREIKADADLKDILYIPPGKEAYKIERNEFKKQGYIDKDRTLWLLVDKSLSEDNRHPGSISYFICYAQLYVNRNPFIILNERKPGWLAPTTLPHTLAAAMMNIARSNVKNDSKIVIADPFSGSGTTFLEAMKFPSISFFSSDCHPLSSQIVKDNLEFFSLSKNKLKQFHAALNHMIDDDGNSNSSVFMYPEHPKKKLMPTGNKNLTALITWGLDALAIELKSTNFSGNMGGIQELRKLNSHKFSSDFISAFNSHNNYFLTRIIFYLVWRGVLKNIYKIDATLIDIGDAVKGEFERFRDDLQKLVEFRELTVDHRKPATNSVKSSKIVVSEGLYSLACSISDSTLRKEIKQIDKDYMIFSGESGDARNVFNQKCESIDIIITDPPYGFNTDYNDNDGDNRGAQDLAALYIDILPKMIKALKDGGQIIFCLPAKSYNGQRIQYFSTKEMIARQLLFEANKQGKEVVQISTVNPYPGDLFRLPYYWNSDRALSRSILHFQIRNKLC